MKRINEVSDDGNLTEYNHLQKVALDNWRMYVDIQRLFLTPATFQLVSQPFFKSLHWKLNHMFLCVFPLFFLALLSSYPPNFPWAKLKRSKYFLRIPKNSRNLFLRDLKVSAQHQKSSFQFSQCVPHPFSWSFAIQTSPCFKDKIIISISAQMIV